MIEVYKIPNGEYDERVPGGMLTKKKEQQKEARGNLRFNYLEQQPETFFTVRASSG